jgi:hypothetical protein
LKKAIENGFFIVRDPGTYDEMAGYIVYNGRFKASPGGYADRIIAAALAWQCVEQTSYGYGRLMLAGGRLDDAVAPRANRVLTFNTKKSTLPHPPKELPPELNEVAGRFESRYDVWDDLLPKEFA